MLSYCGWFGKPIIHFRKKPEIKLENRSKTTRPRVLHLISFHKTSFIFRYFRTRPRQILRGREFRFLKYCEIFSLMSEIILQNDFGWQKRGCVFSVVLKIQNDLSTSKSLIAFFSKSFLEFSWQRAGNVRLSEKMSNILML